MPVKTKPTGTVDWVGPEPLAGRSGLVTGGATGIGRAIVLRLAALGANVGINYWHHREEAESVVRMIEAQGRKAMLLPGDMGEEASVRESVALAKSSLGTIDFLVNNAGGSGGASSDEPIDVANYDDWGRLLRSNLGSAFLCTRYVAPIMQGQKSGRIVNISSICGLTGDCGPAYCAAKAGILGLTRHSAVALAPYIQVNAVLPGFVDSTPHDPRKVGRITPGRKMGHPEEIADMVAYLIAAPQRFLTGSCIVMDGAVTNGVIGRMMDWSSAASLDAR
ncbi:MAG: SDR family NAD(P)-dependent oxidoreductase [Thermoplasmata archaeon]